jgi:hypothetical protein
MAWKPDYITPNQLAGYIRAGGDSVSGDLGPTCASASRAVDRATGRQFGKTDAPESRVYRARWAGSKGMWLVETDDYMTEAGLVIAFDSAADGAYSTTIDPTKVIKYPLNAEKGARPWRGFYLRPAVSTGVDGRLAGFRLTLDTWGWLAVPSTIVDATKLQGSRFAARRDAPFGVAGSPDNGSEIRLLAKADPDVAVMVRDYARKAWAR